jgi:hypothetical protein
MSLVARASTALPGPPQRRGTVVPAPSVSAKDSIVAQWVEIFLVHGSGELLARTAPHPVSALSEPKDTRLETRRRQLHSFIAL